MDIRRALFDSAGGTLVPVLGKLTSRRSHDRLLREIHVFLGQIVEGLGGLT